MAKEISNDEEKDYMTVDQAAAFVGYSRHWFEKVIVPRYNLQKYQKGLKRGALFKKADLEPLVRIRPVDGNGHQA